MKAFGPISACGAGVNPIGAELIGWIIFGEAAAVNGPAKRETAFGSSAEHPLDAADHRLAPQLGDDRVQVL